MLNTAHSILKDDLARAQYLLGCKGISLTEQDKPNQQFLMQVMELSEEIESAEGEQLNQLREEHMKRISETTHVLELASEQEDWDKFKEHTVLLSYWKRVSKLLDR
ncbi:hypothetical protein EDD86DRAFT_205402 [Gorgonomyces haynaldii]|nr:hypothetical protein EDD86DRAFT_205402 [Gorgonomyces haynaldii]